MVEEIATEFVVTEQERIATAAKTIAGCTCGVSTCGYKVMTDQFVRIAHGEKP